MLQAGVRLPIGGYRELAMENAEAGSRLHAVVDEGIPLRSIADTIGRRLGMPVVPVAAEETAEHFTYLTPFVGLDNPAANHATQRTLGWTPEGPHLTSARGCGPSWYGFTVRYNKGENDGTATAAPPVHR